MAQEPMAEPEVDGWYADNEGRFFKVVAIENDGESIEVQHYDGAITELDERAWRERQPRAAEPPEDWSGSVDISAETYRADNDLPSEPDEQGSIGRYEGLD
jgi:hypothetical protein